MCVGWHLDGERDSRGGRLRCAVLSGSSLLSPAHERFAGVGNVTQKIGRSLEVPVRRVNVDVAQIGRQSDHVLADASSTWRAGLQCPDSECVTKVVQARTPTVRRQPETSRPYQRFERALNPLILERSTTAADEDVVIARTDSATAHH